jgi:hypothetical protein
MFGITLLFLIVSSPIVGLCAAFYAKFIIPKKLAKLGYHQEWPMSWLEFFILFPLLGYVSLTLLSIDIAIYKDLVKSKSK